MELVNIRDKLYIRKAQMGCYGCIFDSTHCIKPGIRDNEDPRNHECYMIYKNNVESTIFRGLHESKTRE